jgi:hypothetical protein
MRKHIGIGLGIVLAVLVVAIGGTAGPAGAAEDHGQKALNARSDALNRAYGLGTYARTVNGVNAGTLDGRSPDTKDAADLAHLDGRSPDTIDAARQAHETPPATDLRSPDTRDAAAAGHSVTTTSAVVGDGGFDWTDAGIGAAGGFGVALLLAGLVVLAQRGRGTKLAH